MKVLHMVPPAPGRHAVLLGTIAALLLAADAAPAPDADASKPAGKVRAVTLEPIAETGTKRVILSARAAERLGIQSGKVDEQAIVHKQMVSGLVTSAADKAPAPMPGGGIFGGFGAGGAPPSGAPALAPIVSPTQPMPRLAPGAPAEVITASAQQPPLPTSPGRTNLPILGDAWVLVSLSAAEWERLAKDKPARLLQLATRDASGGVLLAQPSGLPPVEDVRRSMLSVYYIVPGTDHGLTLNRRLRVELQIEGTEDKRKVVPYSALYYDGKGASWVYVNTGPLTFERRRVSVERVVGDVAILSDGPATGTHVVTVGAPLLFGAEIFGK